MKKTTLLSLFTLAIASSGVASADSCEGVLNINKKRLASDEQINLCETYQGKVVLIVNTASKCGYTPQYEGLEQLYRDYQSRGLVVLGFPSNDFGSQEPGSEEQIQSFCRLTYSVQFPMFEKSHVAQGTDDPLFQQLAKEAGEAPAWNFHKYLLGRDGKVIGSFASRVAPQSEALINAIEDAL